MFVPFLLQADSQILGIGRCTRDTLPSQVLMELIVANISRSTLFKDSDGSFLEIDEWPGVQIDETGAPKRIAWTQRLFRCNGTIDLSLLPPQLEYIAFAENELHGSVPIETFPGRLSEFRGCGNKLSGSLLLPILPRRMTMFDVSLNALTGTVDLCGLPESLLELHLNDNKFTGSLFLNSLPANLHILFLSFNAFSGSVELNALPGELRQLWLHQNALSGSLHLVELPATLQSFSADSNAFAGSIDLSALPRDLRFMYLQNNRLVQDQVRFGRIPEGLRAIEMHGNRIGAVVDLEGRVVRNSPILR